MLYSQAISILAFAATAIAAPTDNVSKRAQTVYLAGDSTMAKADGVITGTIITPFSYHHRT
jgi:rhamnogalacturonan acetylesterase